jgi:predicted anti-sigma-YlaC factor YlaD
MNCSEARRLQSRFLALELPAASEAAVREHLELCPRCREDYCASERTFALAWGLAKTDPAEDPEFVSGVLAGIRQRRFERRLASHRRRWLATAAAAAAVGAIGLFSFWEGGHTPPPHIARRPATELQTAGTHMPEPPFVDVEGRDVRVYEFSSEKTEGMRIAFVVNPHMEL